MRNRQRVKGREKTAPDGGGMEKKEVISWTLEI